MAPAGTPPEIITKLNRALVDALQATPGTPARMATHASAEREKWAQVSRASGLKLD